MDLIDIYAPVETELKLVEQKLEQTGDVDFPHLAELVNYSLARTGKLIRPALTFLAGSFYVYDTEMLVNMASALEIMHIATLVHDDAIDHSDTRRGRTTVYKKWGEEEAVLLGDYLFATAGMMTAGTGNLRVIQKFSETLRTISHGEIDQAYHAFRTGQTREHYFKRISQKTAALFMLATESGSVLSNAPEDKIQSLVSYGYNLGIGFQIVDDILDFIGTEEELGKPVGSDLTQGTLTLPSMMLLERYSDDNPVSKLFENKCGQQEIDKAIDMVNNSSIIQDCYATAQDYCDKACMDLRNLPDGAACNSLETLAYFIMQRNK